MYHFSLGPTSGMDSARKPTGLIQEMDESDTKVMEIKKFVLVFILYSIYLTFALI